MTDRPSSAENTDDQLLEEIFQHAKPRPRPSPAARERAFRQLRDEWQRLSKARKRRRATNWAIAASLVTAVFAAAAWWLDDAAVVADFSASIARSTGDGLLINGQASTGAVANRPLQIGDHLQTSGGSRVALRWPSGGSLRMDGETRMRIVAVNTIELQSGRLYFDSTPYGDYQGNPANLRLQTELGVITHDGTQFQARLAGGDLELAVREGEARVDGDGINASVAAGEVIYLNENGDLRQDTLTGFDDRWQWAADIAPELQLNGRTTREVLDWIGRETGRSVRFRSKEARRIAESEPRGIGELPPGPALRTIPVMTSLSVTVDDEHILVDVAAGAPQQ